VVVGGGGRFLILHLKKLQQLAVFDVSQVKVVKYLPLPTNDIEYTAGLKKMFVGLKDLKQIQRWDLTKLAVELTVAAPEGGINGMGTGANVDGPLVVVGNKRIWLVNPSTLKGEPYPSKHWGNDGSAWGPSQVQVSFDGSSVAFFGGGWAGIEVSNLIGNKVGSVHDGGYVHGHLLIAGNGSLVFPQDGGIVRSDLSSKVTGLEGQPIPGVDSAFSMMFQKGKKASLVLFSNSDPRPLATLRDVPELAKDSKLPIWQRVHLIPRAKVLVTVGEGNDRLVLRKFDLAAELEAEGIDYLFVASAPVTSATKGGKYTYKMDVRSKKGEVKVSLQSGPKGMTVSKDGLIQWSVPGRGEEEVQTVIVEVSDGSTQTIFHTFGIRVGEGSTLKR
jgi:hypothetical protein